MSANGIKTIAGRTYKAQLLAGVRPLDGLGWMAVGRGTWVDKTNPPAEVNSLTALTDEIARKQISRFAYLALDDVNGTITHKGHKYVETLTPGPIVAYFAAFTDGELTGESLCEEALFGGPVAALAAPLATFAQVTSPGTMYWFRNRPQFVKGAQDTYEIVAVFEEGS